MKSNYSLEKKEGYLSLVISGEYDITEFLSYVKLIKEECEKEKTYKALVNALDVKASNASIMDRFYLGEGVANVLGGKIKLATVWQEKFINKFGETVAVNRGANVRVFGDMEQAKNWLLGNTR